MRAIIVEDMPQAMQNLQTDLADHCPEVSIVATATSIVQAAKVLRNTEADILFLDILLGDGTGFDLLEIFPDLKAQIIFVTASDEYAIRAFRFAAVDYLLKPVDPELLMIAVERAKAKLNQSNKDSLALLTETIRQPEKLPERISLHSSDKISVVEIHDIVRCESDGNNTRFFLASGEKIYVTRTLKHFNQLLEKHQFIRVHQSHLLNQRFISEYIKRDGGYLKLKNGHDVPVSVRKKTEVMALFA